VTNASGVYTIETSYTKGTHALSNLYFKLDGQTLPGGAYDVSGSGSKSMSFEAQSSGPHDITVQIVDTALYDTSDTKTGVALLAEPFTLLDPVLAGSNVKLSWPALSGTSPSDFTVEWTNNATSTSGTISSGVTCLAQCVVEKPKSSFGSTGQTISFTVLLYSPSRTSNTKTFKLP
jgi:hypothetical protein